MPTATCVVPSRPLQKATGIVTKSGEPKYGTSCVAPRGSGHVYRARVRTKKVQALMGHALIRLTFDTYGYLFKTEEAG